VITLGNWTWGQRDFGGYLAASDRVIRPANMSSEAPGRGVCIAATADGTPVAVINLLGELTLGPAAHPFEVAEHLVEDARKDASVVVVDFHAEATSEKIAMARMLDGKVTAVLGTHTHVQTNDARVLAGGTAAVTDVGMTGPHDSVIGVEAALAIRRMRTQMPVRFHPAEAGVRLEGALVDCDGSGRATSCELVRVEA
jgi:2',3'-cyclic-nucleotide 2'-phosphodiesterase